MPSGNYMVFFMDCTGRADSGDISMKLQLVQFAKDLPVMFIRWLEMLFLIDLNEIHSIAAEDYPSWSGVSFTLAGIYLICV